MKRSLVLLAAAALLPGCLTLPRHRALTFDAASVADTQWLPVDVDRQLLRADDEVTTWPLLAALRAESPAGYRDCSNAARPVVCMAKARQKGRTARLSRVVIGDDSVGGWVALQRGDGRLVIYDYDSSPCGGFVPATCGYRLYKLECEVVSPLQTDVSQQRALCDQPFLGVKQQ